MADLFKVLAAFGAFLGICAVTEWLADNVPWAIWILLPGTLWFMYVAFGNGKEEK